MEGLFMFPKKQKKFKKEDFSKNRGNVGCILDCL